MTAPFCSLSHMAPYYFVTGFDWRWFEVELHKNNAVILECERNGNYYDWIRQEVLRIPYVTQRYCGKGGLGIKLICATFANVLKRYARKSNESGELLCFGYMIVAKKEFAKL